MIRIRCLTAAVAVAAAFTAGLPSESFAEANVITVPLTASSWDRNKGRPGPVEFAGNSILLKGMPHTNDRVRNGVSDGNYLSSKKTFNHVGATSYVKFKTSGARRYQNVYVGPSGLPTARMTTHHSYARSKLIGENTLYFSRVHLKENAEFKWVVASGNYDDKGGRVVFTQNGKATAQQFNRMKAFPFRFAMSDNYGGRASTLTVYEVKLVLPDLAAAKRKAAQEAKLQEACAVKVGIEIGNGVLSLPRGVDFGKVAVDSCASTRNNAVNAVAAIKRKYPWKSYASLLKACTIAIEGKLRGVVMSFPNGKVPGVEAVNSCATQNYEADKAFANLKKQYPWKDRAVLLKACATQVGKELGKINMTFPNGVTLGNAAAASCNTKQYNTANALADLKKKYPWKTYAATLQGCTNPVMSMISKNNMKVPAAEAGKAVVDACKQAQFNSTNAFALLKKKFPIVVAKAPPAVSSLDACKQAVTELIWENKVRIGFSAVAREVGNACRSNGNDPAKAFALIDKKF